MNAQAGLKIAKDAFERIRAQFPSLAMRNNDTEPVELCIDIPVQSGLKYAVTLNFQN